MQELHIRELGVLRNGPRFNSNGITGDRITNSREIMEKLHNKEYQLYFAIGDSRKKKTLRHVFALGVHYQYITDLKDYPAEKNKNRNGFFLIAQGHNVPFQNTNTFVEEYRRHACNFKEALAETLGSAHVSAQTRSQL